jgi:transcriptional regulator with XRE-family HTH domain
VSALARSVGRNIRRARQEAGLTKAELADRAAIHWTVLVGYEGGNGIPILETFVKIAYALDVSPCALLPGLEWDPLGRDLD